MEIEIPLMSSRINSLLSEKQHYRKKIEKRLGNIDDLSQFIKECSLFYESRLADINALFLDVTFVWALQSALKKGAKTLRRESRFHEASKLESLLETTKQYQKGKIEVTEFLSRMRIIILS